MQAQSPINIELNKIKVNESLSLELINYDIEISPVIGFFDGDTGKIVFLIWL